MASFQIDLSVYLGRPWESLRFNCWGLVREVYERELGIRLPAVAADPDNYRSLVKAFAFDDARGWFEPIERPEPWALIGLSRYGRGMDHVGIWLPIDGGRVLHNDRYSGVVCPREHQLRYQGWTMLGYYQHQQQRKESAE